MIIMDVDWISLALDKDKWWAVVAIITNILGP
jgi:hypothetical protein